MKQFNSSLTNYLNLSDDLLRRFMVQAIGIDEITPEALTIDNPQEQWLGLIAVELSVVVANHMSPDAPLELGVRHDVHQAVCIAKMLLNEALERNDFSPAEKITVNPRPISWDMKEKLDRKVEQILASATLIAVRAFMERQSFLHAVAQKLAVNSAITVDQWQAFWNEHEAIVVKDSEVEAAMQKHFPSLAATLAKS